MAGSFVQPHNCFNLSHSSHASLKKIYKKLFIIKRSNFCLQAPGSVAFWAKNNF